YELFDMSVAAAWWRRGGEAVRRKRQITGLDFLFFKDPPVWGDTPPTPAKIAKAAAIAELYGFPDFALEILDAYQRMNPAAGQVLASLRHQITLSTEPMARGWIDKIRR